MNKKKPIPSMNFIISANNVLKSAPLKICLNPIKKRVIKANPHSSLVALLVNSSDTSIADFLNSLMIGVIIPLASCPC